MFGIVLGALMVPTTALAVPTYLLFSNIGLVNTPWAVILPSLVSPFGLYLMRIYAQDAVSDVVLEAARIHRDAIAATAVLGVSIPLVMAQGITAGQRMVAGVDQQAGAVTATEHPLGLGHDQVAHVSGPADWVEAEQRRRGWQLAHERRGLRPGPEIAGDWSARSGYAAGLRIAADCAQTAIFVASDAMALGVLKALHERGRRVPEDVSVVGFDGVLESAYYWPGLTTVVQDFSALGRRALELTLRAIDGEDAPFVDLVAPEIVVRGSTGHRATDRPPV